MSLRKSLLRLCRWYVMGAPWEKGKVRLERLAREKWGKGLTVRAPIPGGAAMDLEIDDLLQSIIFFRGMYERTQAEWFRRLLEPGDVVVDVGANVGLYALLAASVVGPTGTVFAFEPEPGIRERLRHNIAINRFERIRVLPIALSNAAGSAELYAADRDNRGKTSLAIANARSSAGAAPAAVTVDCQTLDGFLAAEGDPRVSLLKVDVEGAELRVFEGAAKLLASDRAPIVFFEASELLCPAFGYHTTDVKRFLAERRYEVFRVDGERWEAVDHDEEHRLEDLIALRPEHRSRPALASVRWEKAPA